MNILFAGSPGIAVPSLKALSEIEFADKNIKLTGLLTNPDSAQGRKSGLIPTDVSTAAVELSALRQGQGLPEIIQKKCAKLGRAEREDIAALKCDLLISFAYGRIFGPKFLELFPMGGINIHPSLLPKYRGPSPITAAILHRDKETGITIQKLGLEMDAGDILAQESFALNGNETTESLSQFVSELAAKMLKSLIPDIARGFVKSRPQAGEPLYCSLITKEQGRLDWNLPAEEIDAQVRAYNPWPLCFTIWGGEELYILQGGVFEDASESNLTPGLVKGIDRDHGILIQTGNGVYAVKYLQRRAKKAMDWKAFVNGARDFAGSLLN